ncbi:hypothetical protein GEI7407_0278 [Geitlerinema sp. PCC 7407]|nr:hypothetical protein GEI7407_0278 [Geitlerinema sp. PCC 7407]
MTPTDWITPSSLWSLWVPLSLLGLIVAAAVYFVRITPR